MTTAVVRIFHEAPSRSPKRRKSTERPPHTQKATAARPSAKRLGDSTRLEREAFDALDVREIILERSNCLGDRGGEVLRLDLALDLRQPRMTRRESVVLENVRRDAVEGADEPPRLAMCAAVASAAFPAQKVAC
jgi:hypothetical protein